MKTKYYLAYGSNLNIGQMRYRCREAHPVGTARLEGYELLFKGSKSGSYLTVEPKAGSYVPVAVWAVSEADERSLDRYEGYPTFYYKKEVTVKLRDYVSGKPHSVNAFVYIMHEDRPFGIPSGQYLGVCLDGYQAFGFNPQVLFDAYMESERKTYEE